MEDYKINEFNEASFKMLRLHKIQDLINLVGANMKGVFMVKEGAYVVYNGLHNYEIKLYLLEELRMEIIDKLTNKEKEDLNKLRIKLFNFINTNNIHYHVKQASGLMQEIFNTKTYAEYLENIRLFEEEIRIASARHGFSGKEKSDPRKAVAEQ